MRTYKLTPVELEKAVALLLNARNSSYLMIFGVDEQHICRWAKTHDFVIMRGVRSEPGGDYDDRPFSVSAEGKAFLHGIEVATAGFGHGG